MSKQLIAKEQVAKEALAYLPISGVIGVGTGSTVNCFIDALAASGLAVQACVASSETTAKRLQAHKLPVVDFNSVSDIPIYIDGADQANTLGQLIKGGGGALTREKILATAAKHFLCLVDKSKCQGIFGDFPLPIEVLDMARSFVARELMKLGGRSQYRQHTVTDNGHVILDVQGLDLSKPIALERQLNQIPGVVCHGLFACRGADTLLVADNAQISAHHHAGRLMSD